MGRVGDSIILYSNRFIISLRNSRCVFLAVALAGGYKNLAISQ